MIDDASLAFVHDRHAGQQAPQGVDTGAPGTVVAHEDRHREPFQRRTDGLENGGHGPEGGRLGGFLLLSVLVGPGAAAARVGLVLHQRGIAVALARARAFVPLPEAREGLDGGRPRPAPVRAGLPPGQIPEDGVDRRDDRRQRPVAGGDRLDGDRPLAQAAVLLDHVVEEAVVAAAPAIDRLLDVAHVEEGAGVVLHDLVDQIRQRLPLAVAGILELVEQPVVEPAVEAVVDVEAVGAGRRRFETGRHRARTQQPRQVLEREGPAARQRLGMARLVPLQHQAQAARLLGRPVHLDRDQVAESRAEPGPQVGGNRIRFPVELHLGRGGVRCVLQQLAEHGGAQLLGPGLVGGMRHRRAGDRGADVAHPVAKGRGQALGQVARDAGRRASPFPPALVVGPEAPDLAPAPRRPRMTAVEAVAFGDQPVEGLAELFALLSGTGQTEFGEQRAAAVVLRAVVRGVEETGENRLPQRPGLAALPVHGTRLG